MKAFQLLLSFLLFYSFSCNSDQPVKSPDQPISTTESSTEKEVTPIPDNRPSLLLDGLYATSTATTFDVRSVFDRDEKTIWKTIKGAGPDEGIMLYFSKETYIKSIRIEGVEGEGLSRITSVEVYANGTPLGDEPEGLEIPVGKNILNLYLRFRTDQDIEVLNEQIEEEYYSNFRVERFNRNKSIAIKTIIIEGINGELKVVSPQLIAGTVIADATLKAESFAYDPTLLFDARKEFAWVEGATGNGEGVKLAFNFEEEVNISGLKIWNGYQRSESHFKSNARLNTFNFGKENEAPNTYTLKDIIEAQSVKLDKSLTSKTFELSIKSAYQGWSYKDLAISEILFYDEKNRMFAITSPLTALNRKNMLDKSKETILSSLLDSRIYNAYTSDEIPMGMSRSIILRSDGTFVFYASEEDESDKAEIIADGNWELVKANGTSATINIFGRLLDFSMLEMYYAGKTDAELSRIFKDKITIENNIIKGEKLISEIKF